MPAPTQHIRYIQYVLPITSKQINTGDIITFLYEGRERWALVLAPSWEGKMHAMVLENMSRIVLQRVSTEVYQKSSLVLYETYISKNKIIMDAGAYRTFDAKKVISPKQVSYDFGYNTVEPNTFMNFGESAIILGYNTRQVYAEEYPQLKGVVRTTGNKGVFLSGNHGVPNVITSYVTSVGLKPNFTSWLSKPQVENEATKLELQKEHLKRLLGLGGVFFATDDELKVIRSLNEKA